MLEELESYVYDNYIKRMVVDDNGVKKISKEELEKLKLAPHEKSFIMYIINKQKIKITEEKITKADRSPYVRDNNYGDIQVHDLQKIDEPVMSKIEYSSSNEKVYEDYQELDEYLERRFIPTYVLFKQKKNANGEREEFLSIRLHHIMALKLSEDELEHVMNYLKEKNIRVGGKGATLDQEFDNYDYVTTYKESALPQSVSPNLTLEKIKIYRQNGDQKIREEIITENMRLVPYVAYRFAMSTKIDQHELESYGYEGLILALEKFDINFKCAFSTYAVAWIRGCILKGIQEIMQGKRDRFYYDYINAKIAVEKENGLTLSEEPELIEDVIDLLVATGKIKDNDKDREYAKKKIASLAIGNISLNDEELIEELEFNGQLADTHDYAKEVLNKISRQELEQVLNTLTAREEFVIRERFGLDDGVPKSTDQVGQMYGVTRERIRQIEAKALRKLRHSFRSKNLKVFANPSNVKDHGEVPSFDEDFEIQNHRRAL